MKTMICHNKWSKPFSNCFIIGPTGNGISIQGSYDTYEMLKKDHPTGNPNDSYIVDGYLYTWSDNNHDWFDVGKIKGPKGDPGLQGEIGPQGLPESTSVRTAYIITYNEDTVNSTIKFNVAGYYKVNKFADKKRHLHRCLSSLFNFFYTEKTI